MSDDQPNLVSSPDPTVTTVTAWSDNLHALACLTLPNRRLWARRHRYKLAPTVLKDGPCPSGAKPYLLWKALLKTPLAHWLDIDAMVTNLYVRVELLCQYYWARNPEIDLFLASDVNGLNTGSLIVRKSPWADQLIKRWANQVERFRSVPACDQLALASILLTEPKGKWHVCAQRVMNSYQYEHYPDCRPYPEGEWEYGDFVLHVPALPQAQRLAILDREYPDRVLPPPLPSWKELDP